MARVPYVQYEEAVPEVKKIYDKQKESLGKILNTTLVRGHCPELLNKEDKAQAKADITRMQQAQEETNFSPRSLRPLLTLLVSRLNGCPH